MYLTSRDEVVWVWAPKGYGQAIMGFCPNTCFLHSSSGIPDEDLAPELEF